MSGVAVVRSLLATNAPVVAVIPAARIISGDLPLNTVMPAIAVTLISGTPRNTVAMTEANRMHTDRVQVSYLFKGPSGSPAGTGYVGVRGMAALVRTACAFTRGTINGVDVLDILQDQEGPDLADAATALYSGSQDYIVRWRS
ncbi:MAG: hypothetical protein ACTS6J_02075 [Burkholderiales bacterium]